MTRYLLAAEADKIQDFIFRSSHLREVVGGSQLLTRFCREGTRKLLARQRGQPEDIVEEDIIVADGGSFSILFDNLDQAREFGQELARLYQATAGGSLTVADPVPLDGNFPAANEASRQALRQAKNWGRATTASEHLPYAAFCASCGLALAHEHEPLHPVERANYICPLCRTKADERDDEGTEFLFGFKKAVVGEAAAPQFSWPSEADDLAESWDPRRYVAYLVADGNGMGSVFNKCPNQEKMRKLSQGLTGVLRTSLAVPAEKLMAQAPESRRWQVPVLPLILGGDDIFALLPAPYALDFAGRFCREYEKLMGDLLRELGIEARPTMAVAVVICKSKYPHTLAHRHGEVLLKEAKRLSKTVALNSPALSIVHFDVILGSRLAGVGVDGEKPFCPTLRPYWVAEGELPLGIGLPLKRLIDQRYELRNLAARRLAQLRALYEPGEIPENTDLSLALWHIRLTQVMDRVARSETQRDKLNGALVALGGKETACWYYVNRPGPKVEAFRGHGLPDLIDAWDFALNLDRHRSEYEEREG
jgi:hypothetical protein